MDMTGDLKPDAHEQTSIRTSNLPPVSQSKTTILTGQFNRIDIHRSNLNQIIQSPQASPKTFKMRFSTIVATTLVAVSSTMATPAVRRNPPVPPPLCQGTLENTPECCATDVLGLLDLDCAPRTLSMPHIPHLPPSPPIFAYHPQEIMTNGLCRIAPKIPSSDADFVSICAAIGQRARCCTLGTVSTIFSFKRD